MVFVDTSAWFAAVVPSDQNHTHAANWLATNSETLITTDYVIDEILTLLRARGERQRAKLLGKKFFDGSIAEIYLRGDALPCFAMVLILSRIIEIAE